MMNGLSHSPATCLITHQSLQADVQVDSQAEVQAAMQADTNEDMQSRSEILNCLQEHVGQCIADAVVMPAQCDIQYSR